MVPPTTPEGVPMEAILWWAPGLFQVGLTMQDLHDYQIRGQ